MKPSNIEKQETMFFLNDYGIVDDRYGRFRLYQEQIRDLLQDGAPIDGIGLQVISLFRF